MKVRGSKADTAWECSGSLVPTDTPYNPHSDEANSGRAKHDALAYVARGEEPPIDAIAELYGVDRDEIARAVSCGRQALAEIDKWLPNRRTEVKVEGPVTIGTVDILSVGDLVDGVPATLAIPDWKSGWSGDDHRRQLMAYADATREMFGMPATGYISAFEIHLSRSAITTHNFTAAQLDGFREHMAEQIRSAESEHPQYAAGAHCKFCPRQNQCQARDEYLRATVMAIEPYATKDHAITREVLGLLYDRSKMLARALAQYNQALDDALGCGPITLPDGRVLALVEREVDNIAAVKVSQILRDEFDFDDHDLAKVLGATESGIERAIKDRVAKGWASAQMRKILGRLREVGAVTKTTSIRKEIING